MARKARMRHWQVRYLDLTVIAPGRNYGAACRWAFRKWLAEESIVSVPESSPDDTFKGVTCAMLDENGELPESLPAAVGTVLGPPAERSA